MKTSYKTLLAVGAALTMGGVAGLAHATNGYFANGYSTETKGMAGAGVAVGENALSLSLNPALGVEVGNSAGFCLSGFMPHRDVTIGGRGPLTPGKHESSNEFFPIPCAGVNVRLDDSQSLGLIITAQGGMNTEYQTNPFAGFGAGSSPLGVDLAQVMIALNYSIRLAPEFDVGIAPVFAAQRFRATGLEAFGFFSTDPANLTNNGYSWSFGGGVKLGAVWRPDPHITIAAAYQSRMFMTEFDEYRGLFAEQGDFDIPPTATIGVAIKPAPEEVPLTLLAEFQHIWYGDIDSIANTHVGIPFNLGADNGAGFGWKDMSVLRLAAIYEATDALTLRAGVSYATDFIDGQEVVFNILAPATIKWHASIGATYEVNENWALSASYTHAFSSSVSGSNPGMGGQPVKLRMDQDEFSLGISYRW